MLVIKPFGVLLLVLAIIWGIFKVRNMSYFKLSEVDFNECAHFGREELVRMSGLKAGENIFNIDLNSVYKKFTKNPWFSKVSVSKELPRKIVVTLRERTPSFVMVKKKQYYLVSSGGIVLEAIKALPKADYLIFSGIDKLTPGTKLFSIFPALKAIVYTLAKNNFISNIKEIRKKSGWVLFLKEPEYIVLLGDLAIEKDLNKFLLMREKLESLHSPFSSLDFRFGRMAVISPL